MVKSRLCAMRSASRTSTVAGTSGRRDGTLGRLAPTTGFARHHPDRFACSSTFANVDAYRACVGG